MSELGYELAGGKHEETVWEVEFSSRGRATCSCTGAVTAGPGASQDPEGPQNLLPLNHFLTGCCHTCHSSLEKTTRKEGRAGETNKSCSVQDNSG